ncbi:MAG: TolC family protein, partial [Acidobacteriaceae bacterium]|nr:TolC family protein [Acidobacteriaceae bacterium]
RRAQTDALRAGYLPQADLLVSATRQTSNLQGIGLVFPGFPSRIGPFRTFNARPIVSQKVIDLSLLASVRAARHSESAAARDIEAVREQTQAAVISLFLETFQAQSRLRAARARLQTAESLLAQTIDREKAGAASQLDLARHRQRREIEQTEQIAAEQDLALLRPALEELLAAPVSGELAEPKLRLTSLDSPTQRPDLHAARERVKAAEQDLHRARRARWPQLTALADYGVLGAGPDSAIATYNLGATLQIPLWTSGRLDAEIRAASLRLEQAKQEAQRLQLAAARQAAQAQTSFAAQTRAEAAAAAAARAARQVLELTTLRYQSGLATTLDTVTAQEALATAEDLEIRSRYQAQLALAQLAFAYGDVRTALP